MSNNAAEDDPFAVFASDSDEEEAKEMDVGQGPSSIRQSLVAMANRKSSISTVATTTSGAAIPNDTEKLGLHQVLLQKISLPWPAPLYLGPMAIVSLEVGGGRGCVATRDLPPGTLVLVEEPLLEWPEMGENKNLASLSTVQYILQQPNANELLQLLDVLHPTVETCLDHESKQGSGMLSKLLSDYEDNVELQEITEFAHQRGLQGPGGKLLSSTDILRLLLVLRYNGLQSGIFLYSAMLNHDDSPSCVKFQPSDTTKYSDVRTTRLVKAGEALTINYVPRVLSHATRRWELWKQHVFDIGTMNDSSRMKMELVANKLPRSSLLELDEEAPTRRIERTISELSELYEDMKQMGAHSPWDAQMAEQVQALEQATLELCDASHRQLANDNHVLLIPCYELHVNACDIVQQDSNLKGVPKIQVLCRLVLSTWRLIKLQESYYGPDHFALARSNNDLAQTVDELLSKSPKHLLSLELPGLDTLASWASLAHKARKEFERIKVLYPHDVESYISR